MVEINNNTSSAFAYLQTFLPSTPSYTVPALRQIIDPATGKLSTFSSILNTDAAHKIIEIMMIAANLTVSKHIGAASAVPQRFHAKLPKTVTSIPTITANPIVDSFLAIKTFATATYDATHQGHFGLQLTSYTHFTSPIRRYFDVIIHHLLAGVTYDPLALQELLDHVNRQERTVDGLQKLYASWKLCDWLQDRIGHAFEGYITGIVGAGVYFLIPDLMLDGFVHASKLSIAPVLGQKVSLVITDVNQITGQIGFKI
jgi:exoribonuclease R